MDKFSFTCPKCEGKLVNKDNKVFCEHCGYILFIWEDEPNADSEIEQTVSEICENHGHSEYE